MIVIIQILFRVTMNEILEVSALTMAQANHSICFLNVIKSSEAPLAEQPLKLETFAFVGN